MPTLYRSTPWLIIPLLILLVSSACQRPETSTEPAADLEVEEISDPYLTVGTATAEDGLSVAYSTRGSGSPALVFVHGWSCDRTYWSEQLETFARHHRVVAVDLGGHGDSGEDRESWTFESLGGDVQAVIRELGLDEVILIGHSMGAPVSLEAARGLPETVIGVIAADSLHDADFQDDPKVMQGYYSSFEKDFRGSCGQMVRSMFLPSAKAELVERIENDMCSGPAEVGLSLFRRFEHYDTAGAMAAIKVPIRAINAAKNPTNLEANRRYSPGFDAVIMEGVGHFLMIDKPAEFNRILSQVIEEITAES